MLEVPDGSENFYMQHKLQAYEVTINSAEGINFVPCGDAQLVHDYAFSQDMCS